MKLLKQIEKYLILFVIFITPLLVIPLFANSFRISKIIILVLGAALLILLKIISTFISGKLKIASGSFDFPIFLLSISYLLSAILITPNKYEAFFTPGSAIVIIAVSLLYFFLNQSGIEKKKVKSAIVYSSIFFSLISILSLSGILQKIPQLPSFVKVSTFNTEGALIPAILFMVTIIPILVKNTIEEKESAKKIFSIVTSIFVASAIILSLFNIFTDKNLKVVLSDFQSSWSIAIDSLKQSPLLGTGPGNYQTSFSQFRPITYNSTANWSMKFNDARNIFLSILTETGLLGLAASILLVLVSFKVIKKNIKEKTDVAISLAILLVLLVLYPSSPTLLMLLIVLLFLNSEIKDLEINLSLHNQEDQKWSYIITRIPSLLVTLPILVGLILFSIQGVKTVYAEYIFKKAADSLLKQDAKLTYEYIQKAVKINPYIDRYRSSFSQVSFALANAMARKETLTDQDKQTIAQLIQQSIAEGKASVILNQKRSENWANLGKIYQSIIPFAAGADQFAIQTYSQAVNFDPINPLTRISLGGVYYTLGRFDEAIRAFELAVISKPDYANAHFNLALALREKGETQKAITQMELVLSLVDKDSVDYKTAKEILTDLEAKRPTTENLQSENLIIPQEEQEPVIDPKLNLPEDANPPVVIE